MALSADARVLGRIHLVQTMEAADQAVSQHRLFTGDAAECGPQREGSSRKLSKEVG